MTPESGGMEQIRYGQLSRPSILFEGLVHVRLPLSMATEKRHKVVKDWVYYILNML